MRSAFFTTILVSLMSGAAFAIAPGESPEPNYAGWNADHTGFVDVGQYIVEVGIKQFYRLHERWPETWVEVRHQGIFQENVRGWGGEYINPDTPPSFVGDVSYRLSPDKQTATIMCFDAFGKPKFLTFGPKQRPVTYRELLSDGDKTHKTTWFSEQLANTDKMRNYALIGMSRRCLALHLMVHGDYPHSWQEFVQSGLCPAGEGAISPWTLKAIGEGTNGIRYRYYPAQEGRGPGFQIIQLNESGKPERFGFSA